MTLRQFQDCTKSEYYPKHASQLKIILLVDLLLNVLVFDYLHLKTVKKKKDTKGAMVLGLFTHI